MTRRPGAVALADPGAPAQAGGDVVLRAVGVRRVAGGAELLRGVSFSVARGELVAVLGPSGAGKSLLVELLAGAARPSGGEVLAFGRRVAEATSHVGYVPQGDVLHGALTLREAVLVALRLRVPAVAASPVLREERLARAAARVSLLARLDTRLSCMSGGERRRASLALELVADPGVLVVDEVTSGLDVASERQVMGSLQALARDGVAVVCVTHTLASAAVFDRVLVLQAGRLVHDGTPASALLRFGIERLDDLYARLAERAPEAWEAERPASPSAADREAALPPRVDLPGPSGLYQVGTLLVRQARLTSRDGLALAVLLLQAPAIAGLVAFAYELGTRAGQAEAGFKLALSSIWLGCVATCQELVKERDVYRRERLAGLSAPAYVAAKAAVLALVVVVQALLLAGTIYAAEPLAAPPGLVAAVLAGGALCGGALGLLVSAAVRTRTAAVGLTPLLLVPQVLLVGTLEPLRGLAGTLGQAMPSHWVNEAMRRVLLDGSGVPWEEAGTLFGFTALFLVGALGLVLARDAGEEAR